MTGFASSDGSKLALTRALASYIWRFDPVVEPLLGGLIHDSYLIRDGDLKFVLQRVNSIFSPSIHENIDAITEHLCHRGIVTFRLLRTREGRLFVDLEHQGLWRVLTYLPGNIGLSSGQSREVRSAGQLIARFHNALSDFDRPLHNLGFPFHDTNAHITELREALRKHHSHRLFSDVSDIASDIFCNWRSLGAPVEGLPSRIIHGDLKWSNILFEQGTEGQRATSFVDFDTFSSLPLYIELGDAWRSWCNRSDDEREEAQLDLALFRASVEGYFEELEVELDAVERLSLIEAIERLSLELAVRFAADSLEESHFGWDASVFGSRGEHNLIRTRGQMSLYRQARETRSERAQILGCT